MRICGGPFTNETHLLANFHIDARVIDIENLFKKGPHVSFGIGAQKVRHELTFKGYFCIERVV